MIPAEEAFARAEARRLAKKPQDGFEGQASSARTPRQSALTAPRAGRTVFGLRLEKGALTDEREEGAK
jgi:hypothetical protein